MYRFSSFGDEGRFAAGEAPMTSLGAVRADLQRFAVTELRALFGLGPAEDMEQHSVA